MDANNAVMLSTQSRSMFSVIRYVNLVTHRQGNLVDAYKQYFYQPTFCCRCLSVCVCVKGSARNTRATIDRILFKIRLLVGIYQHIALFISFQDKLTEVPFGEL